MGQWKLVNAVHRLIASLPHCPIAPLPHFSDSYRRQPVRGSMRPLPLAVVLAAVGLASLHAWVAQGPQTTFRAGTDLVQVDVSVLDHDRRPVRGLTAADFTVLEDGKARPVVAFTAVDLPERVQPSAAPWTYEIGSDVASNEIPQEGRLVIILMDRSIPDGFPTVNAKAIARMAVNELGAGDMAAVV